MDVDRIFWRKFRGEQNAANLGRVNTILTNAAVLFSMRSEARRPKWYEYHEDFATKLSAKTRHAPKGYENTACLLCRVTRTGGHPVLRNAPRIHRRIFVTLLAKIVLTRPSRRYRRAHIRCFCSCDDALFFFVHLQKLCIDALWRQSQSYRSVHTLIRIFVHANSG